MLGAGVDRSFDDIPLSQNHVSPPFRAAMQQSFMNSINRTSGGGYAGQGNSFDAVGLGNGNDGGRDGLAIPLPIYSARIQDVLQRGNVLLDFELFIEETAYHIIRHGDMKSKSDYQDFGQRLLVAYPCLRFPGITTAWV